MAQEGARPALGERVRVLTSDGLEHQGLLNELGGEALELQVARSEWLTLPTSSIERLWVYRGGRRAVGRGLRIGALAGVTGGTVIGALLSGCGDCSRVPSAGTGAIFFGGLGAMTGLIVGSLIKTGPWYEAGWPAEVDVSLDFRARFQVSMSIMVDRRD